MLRARNGTLQRAGIWCAVGRVAVVISLLYLPYSFAHLGAYNSVAQSFQRRP